MENRFGIALLLLVLVGLFWPTLNTWAFEHPEHWYRPYIIWAIVIFAHQLIRAEGRRRND